MATTWWKSLLIEKEKQRGRLFKYSTEHGRADGSGEQATWADGQGRK
jgi:hypothetical protein